MSQHLREGAAHPANQQRHGPAQVSLASWNWSPPPPPVPYVALYKGEHRSALVSSITMLAQSCYDFTCAFQAVQVKEF